MKKITNYLSLAAAGFLLINLCAGVTSCNFESEKPEPTESLQTYEDENHAENYDEDYVDDEETQSENADAKPGTKNEQDKIESDEDYAEDDETQSENTDAEVENENEHGKIKSDEETQSENAEDEKKSDSQNTQTETEESESLTADDEEDLTLPLEDLDTSRVYKTGDIIYLDGSSSSAADYDKSKTAVAVVFFDANGNRLGLGVWKITQQKWAETETVGLNTNFEKISSSYDTNTSTISGDLDGSDNWNEISLADKNGAENQTENYPGFSLVNSYAEKNNLTGTNFEAGWYAPSLFELQAIYETLDELNSTLEKITSKTNLLSTSKTGYWSASQYPEKDINAWYINFATGEIKSAKKTTQRGFRVIRKLK